MHLNLSEKVANKIVHDLDAQIWNSVADNSISTMPKYKLAAESEKMFNDFTTLISNQQFRANMKLEQEVEQKNTFKQNLLVGGNKICELSSDKKMGEPKEEESGKRSGKQRLSSAIQLSNKRQQSTHNKLFRLTMAQIACEEERKTDDGLRTSKYDNIRYNQFIEKSKRQRRTESQHRSNLEKKRFKEMKVFTYDYNGKLVSLPKENKKNQRINVLNIKSHFGNYIKTQRESYKKLNKPQQILQIINKRIIGGKEIPANLLSNGTSKQNQKQKEEKEGKVLKNLKPTENMLDSLKEENKVSVGVIITDINSKQRFTGRMRDESEVKNLKLNKFRGQFRQLQTFRERLAVKKYKVKQAQPLCRTEYDEPSNLRLQTELTGKQSRVYTAATTYSKRRGKIDVKNQRLYTNFIQDFE